MVLATEIDYMWTRTEQTHEVSIEFEVTPELYEVQMGAGWQTITGEQAAQMMSELDEFLLLDVRTQAEFDSGYILGAVLIPYDELWGRAHELPSLDTPILIYCRTGRRSEVAAQTLVNLGFTRIYDFGGIYDWTGEITQ